MEAVMMRMKSLKQAKPHFQLLYYHYQSKSKSFTTATTTISSLLQQQQPTYPTSSSQKPTNSKLTLTQKELTKINLLVPRLCLSDNLTTAIHLTATSLLTNPPPKSISFSILIHFLTSQPDMTKPMSLLTILRHTPQAHPHLTYVTTMLAVSYVKKKRPKEAFKVYQWMLRPGSPCKVDKIVFLTLISGFCESGLVLEALRILKDMVDVGFVPGDELRKRVYRSLLMEARVREAVAIDRALCFYANGGGADCVGKVRELLDSVITNWTE